MNPYGRVFRALNEAKISYLVVGGVALNLLGYERFTGDLDILLALDRKNVQRMADCMRELGYQQRLPVSIDPEYLRHCKRTTAEQRLNWLAAAVEFASAPKKMVKRRKM